MVKLRLGWGHARLAEGKAANRGSELPTPSFLSSAVRLHQVAIQQPLRMLDQQSVQRVMNREFNLVPCSQVKFQRARLCVQVGLQVPNRTLCLFPPGGRSTSEVTVVSASAYVLAQDRTEAHKKCAQSPG